VFDLEVQSVSHQERGKLLADEIKTLRGELQELLPTARHYRLLSDRRAALQRRLTDAETRLDLLTARLAVPAFELLGPVAPETERTR
jgi:hypothetical protein